MSDSVTGWSSLPLPGVRANAFCAALLPEPTLPGLPGDRRTPVVGQPRKGPVAGALLPFGVHAAARAQPADPTKPACALRFAVRGCKPDVIRVWSKPFWRPAWDYGRATYLESDTVGSLPPPLYCHRRWS